MNSSRLGSSVRPYLAITLVLLGVFSQAQVYCLREDLDAQIGQVGGLAKAVRAQTERADAAETRAKEVFQVGQAMALKCSQLAEKYQDAKNAAIQCMANQSLLMSGD